ncbi:MAG: membrane protein insertion efficiency factor YidD [Catonella sp.]|nr:membrane protein insertion efficiency factor YidD [Catonella sp.]MDY6357849.1 membrane protein insertion efficiency factor YidD [Catonella sp.]
MKKLLILLIKFYKRYISPYKGGPTCRYIPSCSTYAMMAIEKHGAIKGSVLAVKRIMRCNRLFPGGYDPVP